MSGKTPRSVVTGAAGFIGSHMVEALADAGHDVVATDLASALDWTDGVRRMCADVVRARAKTIVPADLTQPGSLDEVVAGADTVFHVASIFSYSASWEALHRVNVAGSGHLMDSIARHAPKLKRIVLIGAGGIYGIPSRPEDLPLHEGLPPDPPNDYQRSKLLQEFLVSRRALELRIPFSVLRPTTVYGARQIYGVPDMLRTVARGPIAAMPSSFTGRVPWVEVRDVCRAALHLATVPAGENDSFNVTDDSRMTTVEVFRFLAQVFGKPFVTLPAVPVGALRTAAMTAAGVEQRLAGLMHRKPAVERDMAAMLGADFVFSNEKLKATGFRFQYPDPKPALVEMARWFEDNDLL